MRLADNLLFWANGTDKKEYILIHLINNIVGEWKIGKKEGKKAESKKKAHPVHKLPTLAKKCH